MRGNLQNLTKHSPSYTVRDDGETECKCECGATWSFPKETKQEKMRSIFDSHLAYFNKPATLVL